MLQAIYLYPVEQCIKLCLPPPSDAPIKMFRERYQNLVSTSLSQTSLAEQIKHFMERFVSPGLHEWTEQGVPPTDEIEERSIMTVSERERYIATTLISLDETGLGGATAQRHLAESMSRSLADYVRTHFAKRWASPSTCSEEIECWVQDSFARYVVQVLNCMRDGPAAAANESVSILPEDVSHWKETALSHLGQLRLEELFDIINDWDRGSQGAIEDLKRCVTTTLARAQLITCFTTTVTQRLLHPGASTTRILRTYIRIIRAFNAFDPRGVLLARVARPIRRYLRERDDTVRIIIGGLLAEPTEDPGATDALVDLAGEMARAHAVGGPDDADADLEFDDMAWQPDPVDAGPEYRRGARRADVLGTMISLFDARDVFVKEFQHILGERLLRATDDFAREVRVLELLRARFGDASLQACEVMLYDILESGRVDALVQATAAAHEATAELEDESARVAFSTKILSRLFWPALRAEEFRMPPALADTQTRFERAFERHKANRKLTWLYSLGSVHVELQLGDRGFENTVQPWQASVISAFGGDDSGAAPVSKTAAELEQDLEMGSDLVENALTFWVGKLILHSHADGTYTVLETLPKQSVAGGEAGGEDSPAAISAAAATASAAANASDVSALRSNEDVMEEKMAVFWQFIQGMLTNQGQMPLQQIVMMLQFAVPGGFPFGKEDLRNFLGRRVDEGKLEIMGGNYKLVK